MLLMCVLNLYFALTLRVRRRNIFYVGTLLLILCMCAGVCVHVQVCVCVCVLFWWCRLVYSSNYASWCMSVLMPAYVCMFTAF